MSAPQEQEGFQPATLLRIRSIAAGYECAGRVLVSMRLPPAALLQAKRGFPKTSRSQLGQTSSFHTCETGPGSFQIDRFSGSRSRRRKQPRFRIAESDAVRI